MIPCRNQADTLSLSEKEVLHRNILRILAEIGLQVEHDGLLSRFGDAGWPVDRPQHRVRFPVARVESFLDSLPKLDWSTRAPRLVVRGDTFSASFYVDPANGGIRDWTPELFERYFGFIRRLPGISSYYLMGCPWTVPSAHEPIHERLNAWRMGAAPAGSLHPFSASGAIWDLTQAYAEIKGVAPREVFAGVCYLISPLRFSAEECRQYCHWTDKGLWVDIGSMPTAGTSTPVTLAGHVAVAIAEQIALAILQQVVTGNTFLTLSPLLGATDMRTMMRPYGRPELPVANGMVAAMARKYGVGCFGHSGLTDAKTPSEEAAAQKCITALGTLLSGSDAFYSIGGLSMDELYSPVQALLDMEIVSALRRFEHDFEVSEESIGFEAISEAGPGGMLLSHEHTVGHFRGEYMEPELWQRTMLSGWRQQALKSDQDKARVRALEMLAEPAPDPVLPDEDYLRLRRMFTGV